MEINKKTNKQLFTEPLEKSPLADDLLEFLNDNFPQEGEQKFQSDPKLSHQLTEIQQSQKVQQIHQKYINSSYNVNQSQISYDKSNKSSVKNIWDNSEVEDQRFTSCRDHKLPLIYRMPMKRDNQNYQILPACQKCIQMVGVYEGDSLQKEIDESILYFLNKRFEHFYRPQDVEARTKQLMERVRHGELEIRENTFLLYQYQIICERYENEARALFSLRIQAFDKFKARNYTGDDNWVVECMMNKRVLDENIFVAGMKKTMKEMGNRAVEDCKKMMEEQLTSMMDNLRRKLEV